MREGARMNAQLANVRYSGKIAIALRALRLPGGIRRAPRAKMKD